MEHFSVFCDGGYYLANVREYSLYSLVGVLHRAAEDSGIAPSLAQIAPSLAQKDLPLELTIGGLRFRLLWVRRESDSRGMYLASAWTACSPRSARRTSSACKESATVRW